MVQKKTYTIKWTTTGLAEVQLTANTVTDLTEIMKDLLKQGHTKLTILTNYTNR